MYSVFEVDYSFDEYGIRYILVGAKSKTDLLKNWKNVRYRRLLTKIDKIENYPGKEIGDTVFEPIASWIKKGEIRKIENMFTDVPYVVLSDYVYVE